MRYPTVAVVIPARNAGLYLEDTLISILGQEHRPDEIIVVDDCSTDNTAEVLKQFNSSGVRTVTGEGRGAPAAINKGVESTTCELIAHFDADDLMLPQKLRQQVSLFASREGNSLGLVSSDLRMFCDSGEDDKTFLERRPGFLKKSATLMADGVAWFTPPNGTRVLCREHCIDVKGVYSRRAWREVGGFNTTLRCAEFARTIRFFLFLGKNRF